MVNAIKRIFKNNLSFINSERNEHYYRDACDGAIYQNLLKSKEHGIFINKKAYTLLMNTDGVSLCTKSDISIWPIYLALLEIDIKQRFCLENIIIAGIRFIFFVNINNQCNCYILIG